MIAAAPGVDAPADLRQRLADLYAAYDEALDENALDRWPDLFTADCLYKVTARENYDAGLPIALIYAESRAMLADRVLVMSAGPGRIANDVPIDLPRPRDVSSPEFNEVRRDLARRLTSHVAPGRTLETAH